MPTFGNLFTYAYSFDLIGGRRFYRCTLIRDAYSKQKGTEFVTISIEPPNRLWFDTTESVFITMKPLSLEKIQSEVFNMFIKDLRLTHFTVCTTIEDKYGTFIPFRTTMFIDQYMNALHDEFTRSVSVIARHWKRVVSNPNYLMCRRRLAREFQSLTI